ncbi:hypothetical protein EDB83DRAFT_2446183 [Lactarius deliciosus]|nr:hypothetical protein EDB83DRAFT_2446183 [Lactarius deliciosus]
MWSTVDVVRIAVVVVSTSTVMVVTCHAHCHRCAHLVVFAVAVSVSIALALSYLLMLLPSLCHAHHCRRCCACLVGCACCRHLVALSCPPLPLMSSSSSGPVRVPSFVAERPSDGGIVAVVRVRVVCGCVVIVVGVGHDMSRRGVLAASGTHVKNP